MTLTVDEQREINTQLRGLLAQSVKRLIKDEEIDAYFRGSAQIADGSGNVIGTAPLRFGGMRVFDGGDHILIDTGRIDLREYGAYSCREAVSDGTVSDDGLTVTVPVGEDPGVDKRGYLALYGAGATTGLATPEAPATSIVGGAGSASVEYRCVVTDRWGGVSAVSEGTTIANAPDAPSVSNYVLVSADDVDNLGHTYHFFRNVASGGWEYIGAASSGLITPEVRDDEVEDWSGATRPDPFGTDTEMASFTGRNQFERRRVTNRQVSGGDVIFTLETPTTTKGTAVKLRGCNSQPIADAVAARAASGKKAIFWLPPGHYPCVTGDLDTDSVITSATCIFFELVDDTGVHISRLRWIPLHLGGIEQVADPNDDRGIVSASASSVRRVHVFLDAVCDYRSGTARPPSNSGADTWCNVHLTHGNILDSRIYLVSELFPMVYSELAVDTDTHGVGRSNNDVKLVVKGYGGSIHCQAVFLNGPRSFELDMDCKGPPGTPFADGVFAKSHCLRFSKPIRTQGVHITDQLWYGGGKNANAAGKNSIIAGAETADVADVTLENVRIERSTTAALGYPAVNRTAKRFKLINATFSDTAFQVWGVEELTVEGLQMVEDAVTGLSSQASLLGVQRCTISGQFNAKPNYRYHQQLGRQCSNITQRGSGGTESGANLYSADRVTLDLDIDAAGGFSPYTLLSEANGVVSDLTVRGSWRTTADQPMVSNPNDVVFGLIKFLGFDYSNLNTGGTIAPTFDLGESTGSLLVDGGTYRHAKDGTGSVIWRLVHHDGSSSPDKITLRNLQLERPAASSLIDLVSAGSTDNAKETLEVSEVYHGAVPMHRRATTTELEDVTDAVNTIGKFQALRIENTTTSSVVRAAGSAAGSIWVDEPGATAHTPV